MLTKLYLSILCSVVLTSCFAKEPAGKEKTMSQDVSDQKQAVLQTVHGSISIRFYPEKAPKTVARITSLIKSKFYNGITFHRVIPSFVVQGGDPSGNGTGGSGKTIEAEFNDIPHVKGTVAMARKGDPNSADSQFYIALSQLQHLDGKYTVFGQVTEGLDILDKIRKGDKIISFYFP